MTDPLIENDQLVDGLRGALRDGETGLEYVPKMLRLVLEGEAWRKRYDRIGRSEVEFKRFADFVRARPTQGLGSSVDLVRRIVSGDPVTLDLLDEAMQQPAYTHADVDNIHVRPSGTRADTALRRLRKDAPELHAKVLAKELSPHKAMVQAGFRNRKVSIPVDDPESAARTIRRQFKREALIALVAALLDDGSDQ